MKPRLSGFLRGVAVRIVILFLALFVALQVSQQCAQQQPSGGRFDAESQAIQRIAVSLVRRAQVTRQAPTDAQFLQESQAYLQAQRPSIRITRTALQPVRNGAGDVAGYRLSYRLADEKGSLDVNVCMDREGKEVGCGTIT